MQVVEPACIEAALAAADQARNESRLKEQLLEREVEQLRYEAERAYRQYDAVDPANRLVAESLEQKWNSALGRVQAGEARLRELSDAAEKTVEPDRDALLALAEGFPRIWADAQTDMKIKKRIARILIEEIVARVEESRHQIKLIIRWKGGKHTCLQVKKNRTGRHRFCTDKEVVELVRELATVVPDRDIARILNRLGKKTGKGLSWKQARICTLRNYHRILVFSPEKANREYCNMKEAAAELDISPMSVRRLITKKILPVTTSRA